MPITQGMTNIGYVFVAVISGLMVIGGQLTVGMIQSFIQYLRQFSQPINQTVQISSILQATIAALNRVFEFLDEQEEIKETENPEFPIEVKGAFFKVRDYLKFLDELGLIEPSSVKMTTDGMEVTAEITLNIFHWKGVE